MAKIFLSVPILEKPEFKMIYSVYQSILSLKGHQVRLYVNENDSLISRVRNVHMSVFLNDYPDYDYFCSIDSDIEIGNCFPTNNIFTKLLEADKDFVGGLYALKQFDKPPLCSSIPLEESINRSNIPFDNGIIEMLWLSSGCWFIKRSVIEKMVNAYPELEYVGDDNVAGKKMYALCNPAIFEVESNGQKFKKYLSEDWSFPLDPLTNVLCKDFEWKKIKDINIGEEIIAFDEHPLNGNQKRQMRISTVTGKIFKNLQKVKIITENGIEIITTKEHEWLIKRGWRNDGRKGRKNGTRITNPKKSYWEKTDNLKEGDYLYNIVDNVNNSDICCIEYMKGYLNGAFDGDGCVSKNKKWNSTSVAFRVCDIDFITRIKDILNKFSISFTSFNRKMKNPKHREMFGIRLSSEKKNLEKFFGIYDGRKSIKEHSNEFCNGYMAGVFDAEGNYDGASISISQWEFPTVVEKIEKYSKQSGFLFKRDPRRFRMCGVNNVHRFFMVTRPSISRKMKLNGQTKGKDRLIMNQKKVRILKIINLDEIGEMICLTTDSGTFIANGIASHNCHRWKNIGGKIYADTSIVLKHIGKIPYTLWPVELVARKKEEINPQIEPKLPNVGFDLKRI